MDSKHYILGGAVLAAAVALGGFSPILLAEGYVSGLDGTYLKDRAGDCVHTRGWSPATANLECDPDIVALRSPAEAAQFETVTKRISLNADTLFDFDKSTLTQAGKEQLDQVAKAAEGANRAHVEVTGYADRIGPESYNLDLSGRRARAVKDYLVSKGISADLVTTAAKGEEDPVVQCEGLRGDPLIKCLQPNRRSVVEFSAFEDVQQPVGGQQQ